jgi:hypothetical protein
MISKAHVFDFFKAIDQEMRASPGADGQIFLIGETSQLIEGWQRWNTQIDFYSVVAPSARESFDSLVETVSSRTGITAVDEFPGDVVPLPEEYALRSRPLSDPSWYQDLGLKFEHFDPSSVSYRYIMRGSEEDYNLVLRFLERSWITEVELDSRLEKLLPKLTFESIQQDPAELRRRYSGLKQMWRARQAAILQ